MKNEYRADIGVLLLHVVMIALLGGLTLTFPKYAVAMVIYSYLLLIVDLKLMKHYVHTHHRGHSLTWAVCSAMTLATAITLTLFFLPWTPSLPEYVNVHEKWAQ